MTGLATLRKRLASKLQLRLGHAGLTIDGTSAAALARQALRDVNAEALLAQLAAADAAAAGFETVADGGEPPADLEDRRAAWTAARETLAADPAYAAALAERTIAP